MLVELKQCFMEAYDDNQDGKIDIREVMNEHCYNTINLLRRLCDIIIVISPRAYIIIITRVFTLQVIRG